MTKSRTIREAFTPRAVSVHLPDGHRFPMRKYGMVAERLEAVGWQMHDAPDIDDAALARVHEPDYLDAVANGRLSPAAQRRLGFPQSPAMVQRARVSAGGTLAAARRALAHGWGVQLAGGTHHAFADRGEGFCVYNDLVVAARALLAECCVASVLIVDLDVHQGNGTAALCADDVAITTFSMHGARNYPFLKVASDVDVALPDATGDDAYLSALAAHLPPLMAATPFDLVLLQAGVDVLEGDRFGRLALTSEGVEAREGLVAGWCRQQGIPVAVTLGGGYHPQIERTVDAHVRSVQAVADALGGSGPTC